MRLASVVSIVSFTFLALAACSSNDSNTGDGGSDAAPEAKPDHAAVDAGVDAGCPSGLACEVCDGGYTPTQMTAPYANPAKCTATDIGAFVTACGVNGTDTTCTDWQNAEATSDAGCYACIYSTDTDPSWGVYVCNNTTSTCLFNSGGCFDVALGTVADEKQAGGAGSCGDIVNADFGCEDYACSTCNGSDYDTCISSVDSNQCATYSDAYNSTTGPCTALDDASATVTSCYGVTDNDLTTMTTIMCGTK
jgi:hypothetical protein